MATQTSKVAKNEFRSESHKVCELSANFSFRRLCAYPRPNASCYRNSAGHVLNESWPDTWLLKLEFSKIGEDGNQRSAPGRFDRQAIA